ncbi:ORC ubiquitin ligase 1 isoform X1 [Hemiscyllium ocellatum]|uniref:ORC ubiquitin ligase 1 isoform X1 n=1 Tax=Hemiscyllium ocellatum TaxID=170820 RepID=UPI0029673B4C|nr:ORC ubiquitin ligase 1 isoform X1 [Hemiscyllium ocellatum]
MQKPALQNVQNVTLSLTLPISCQICLGKVRQPVICSNNHVFCFMCMQSWLKNSTQCPTCRIPITSENPFKEVLGGTDGTENCDSPSVKRHLRKTRLDLLHREYEEEIESLQKEIEDLRGKNLSLESQLQTVFDARTLSPSNKGDNQKHSPTEQDSVPDLISPQEWRAKLKAATEIYEKSKADLDKLKEANRKLRVQNGDLVRENLHLKAEIDSRSPQKFGRFTVAALQSKVEQYEREMNRLKRALERSDKYIEDMELQIAQLKGKREEKENEVGKFSPELPSTSLFGGENRSSRPLWKCSDDTKENRIVAMRRSLTNIEQPLVNQLDGILSTDSNLAYQQNLHGRMTDLAPVNRVPADNGLLTTAPVEDDALCLSQRNNKKEERHTADESEIQFELPSPCTPSTSLGALHLQSTDDEVSPLMKRRQGRKRLTHLRKLCFDDAGLRNVCSEEQKVLNPKVDCNIVPSAGCASSSLTFWDMCQSHLTESIDKSTEKKSLQTPQGEVPLAKAETTMPNLISSPSASGTCFAQCGNVRSRTSSETSMDAAYREKISELDFMLDESEHVRNAPSSLMSEDFSDLDLSLTADLAQCTELLNEAEKRLEQKMQQKQPRSPPLDTRDMIANTEGQNLVPLPVELPVALNTAEEPMSSVEKTSFQSSFSSPFLSVSSDLSNLQQKKPSLWNSCLTPESEKLLDATNRCQASKRKPQCYGEELSSPSKSLKKTF